MSKVLVTGGVGFIGLNLVQALLEQGHQIDIIDDLSRGVLDKEAQDTLSHPAIGILKLDLVCDALDQLNTDYDFIFHLAAIIGVKHVLKAPFRVLNHNIAMLSNILKLAQRQKKLKRFLFASTSEVNAGALSENRLPLPTPELTSFTIPDILQPRTSYLLSKIYGEAMCVHSGIPYTVFRPHNIYGPRMGMSHVIPELFFKVFQLQDGETLPVYSIQHQRTFCYVTDFIKMLLNVMLAQQGENQIVNLGVERPEISIYDLAKEILVISGKSEVVITDAGESAGSPVRRCPDMNKIAEFTECAPEVNLHQGLNLTYQWYMQNVFSNQELCAQ